MLKPNQTRYTETNSGVPVAVPTRLKVPSQTERILAHLRLEQMRAREMEEFETMEESDDFELDDGEEWFSPYEENFEVANPDPLAPAAPGESANPTPPAGDDVPRNLNDVPSSP